MIDIGLESKKKVLVADDEKSLAGLMEDFLSADYHVVLAYDGRSALQKARWEKPDIILVDMMMPFMGGFELVRALQGDEATKSIPVIGMTATAFDDSTVRMVKMERNVVGFLRKPFTQADLKKQIEIALSRPPQ